MSLIYDKRLLNVVFDHAQRRIDKPRVGVVARGFDFLNGSLTNMWVSPITGVLQSIPNSEEPEYQTTNTGRWAKRQVSGITTINANASGSFEMMAASEMHVDSAIHFTGAENTLGVGAITTSAVAANTGQNVAQYAYGSGTETDGILEEFGWGDTADYTVGESVRVYLDGRIEIWRNGQLMDRGAFSGGGYQFGSVKGGSYARPSDQFVFIRAEVARGRYLLLTSSLGGVYQYAAPWAVDTYNPDGTIATAAQPVVSAAKQWFRIPTGGCTVVWSPVEYATPGTAISDVFALSEPPGGGRSFSGKTIPYLATNTVTLLNEAGTGAFVTSSNRCRVQVQTSTAPVWIDGTSTRYDPTTKLTTADEQTVNDWLRGFTLAIEDGPEGATATLEISLAVFKDIDGTITSVPVPVDAIEEVENRPIRIELVAHPDDPDAPETIVLLDGVGGPPELIDGGTPEEKYVRIEVRDRLTLLKDAEVTETVVFDGSDFCKPAGPTTDSAVRVCLKQGAFLDSEMDLPDIDFPIEHVAPQRAGDWSFEAKAGEKWWDVLCRLFDFAPSLVWGVKPYASTNPTFFVVDPATTTTPVGTLYRTPDDAATAGATIDDNLGAQPILYSEHKRTKLPNEGNLVRVLGFDPAAQKAITTYRSDDDSRDPAGTKDGRWLGSTRTVKFESASMTTQEMVERVADSLAAAVQQRSYVDPFRSFMLFKADGAPVWRGDLVTLDKATKDGDPVDVRISSFTPEIVDESGGGLMDSTGILAPISIRLCNYTGGALVGLGGHGERSIVHRHRKRMEEGGWRARGSHRIPDVSPFSSVIKAL